MLSGNFIFRDNEKPGCFEKKNDEHTEAGLQGEFHDASSQTPLWLGGLRKNSKMRNSVQA